MKIDKYGFRHWAVYDDSGELVCVTVYKKGALEVVRRLSATSNETASRPKTDTGDIMKVLQEIKTASSKIHKITKELLPQLQV